MLDPLENKSLNFFGQQIKVHVEYFYIYSQFIVTLNIFNDLVGFLLS